jgi:Flp pilus assembly protein protease CpaA
MKVIIHTMIQLLQQLILIVGTLVGGVTDAKTGYIYDWLTTPMIVLGLVLSVIGQMWVNVVLCVIATVFLYLMYYFGKIGGGDVKLFAGIILLNPYNNVAFLMSIFFFATTSALIFYSIFYTIKYFRKGINIQENHDDLIKAGLLGLVSIVYLGTLYAYELVNIFFIIVFGFLLLAGLIFVGLQTGIKKNFFEKKVALKDLEEDEVISFENNSKKVLSLFKTKGVVGEKEILALKKMKVKEICVLRNLPPFGPFIFVGVCLAFLLPSFFELLFI